GCTCASCVCVCVCVCLVVPRQSAGLPIAANPCVCGRTVKAHARGTRTRHTCHRGTTAVASPLFLSSIQSAIHRLIARQDPYVPARLCVRNALGEQLVIAILRELAPPLDAV